MRLFNSLSVLSLALLVAACFAQADREDSLSVFPQLKRSKKILAGFSDFLATAQADVLLSEESYIRTSIADESSLLNQLTADDVQVSGPDCAQFIRQNTKVLMSLTGIAYTNCLNDADDQVFDELSRLPNLQLTREQYNQFNLLGAFRGENIFIDPSKIRDKLSSRLRARVNLPTPTQETVDRLRTAFDGIKTNFRACMGTAQARLADNLQYTSAQVRAICAAEAANPK